MHVANTTAEARCLALEAELANLRDTNNHDNQKELINHFSKLETTDSQITKLTDQVTHLQVQNDLFRAENNKIKQYYKELYDSIKIIRAKHIEQVTKLTTENVNLKTSFISTRDKHAIDVETIVPRLRNNRDAHLYYLRHLKESVETICDIVEEAKVEWTVSSRRCQQAKGVNKLPVEDQPRTNKSHLRTSNRADSSSHLKRT
nr:hypothetical protein [Tanacetum cinerariifolium]